MNDEKLAKIEELNARIDEIKRKQLELSSKLRELESERENLKSIYELDKLKNQRNSSDWHSRTFPWTERIHEILKVKFKFPKFRLKQLAAINATLDRKDVLLLMPTGGGKSLVYQLPALVDAGMTLVVSPLISLVEDQLIALKKFDIKSTSINASSSKEHKKTVHNWMTSPKFGLKLLYVTPEWLEKSKQFMSYLQKAHKSNNLARIAIDEVHCCSTWGHDFRKEYQFLGLLKPMFPDVPFLGLTATATLNILRDTQNMLGIEDCVVLTAPFNRRNLFYCVINKSSDKKDSMDHVSRLLDTKFKGKSGIIYVTTIKETEELTQFLRQEKGLSVMNYHSQLEAERKRKVHQKWLANGYQAIVATIAFGMGIDKPDVRFVIHFSMPKSMEGLYQESGRAGRDGEFSECILMFSLHDHFRVLGMASSKVEESNARQVLDYCLENQKCRRQLISNHFEEVWEQKDCEKMCDFCAGNRDNSQILDVTNCVRVLHSIIGSANENDAKLTMLKLVNCYVSRANPKEFSLPDFPKPNIGKTEAELIISHLISSNHLRLEKGYNLYTVFFYIQKSRGVGDGETVEIIVPNTFEFNGFPKRNLALESPKTHKKIKLI